MEIGKYVWRFCQPALQICTRNWVSSNMAVDSLPFVTWLYATTLIQDGIAGKFLSEEAAHFYELSLQTMQKVVGSVDLKVLLVCSRKRRCIAMPCSEP
ncbi:hypothetical protein DM02DRAFT_91442 [Periconia macrospinosa]|uniref:Uncharacterized protein n=1 Tax=Periconia macrospinosa TaxID=97972 RepID=A0A2V1CWG7_9PLEO|nr:hypothetical protein DM02DRAFT_91442 [Periconia macrospinosa]